MDTQHTDPWADWSDRMDAFRSDVAAHAADVAESGADIAAMGVERTAGLLLALTYETRYGVTARPVPVAPVTVPMVPVTVPKRLTVRGLLRSWVAPMGAIRTAVAA